MKYPLIAAHFAGARHGFEIKTGILTVSLRERTNSERRYCEMINATQEAPERAATLADRAALRLILQDVKFGERAGAECMHRQRPNQAAIVAYGISTIWYFSALVVYLPPCLQAYQLYRFFAASAFALCQLICSVTNSTP